VGPFRHLDIAHLVSKVCDRATLVVTTYLNTCLEEAEREFESSEGVTENTATGNISHGFGEFLRERSNGRRSNKRMRIDPRTHPQHETPQKRIPISPIEVPPRPVSQMGIDRIPRQVTDLPTGFQMLRASLNASRKGDRPSSRTQTDRSPELVNRYSPNRYSPVLYHPDTERETGDLPDSVIDQVHSAMIDWPSPSGSPPSGVRSLDDLDIDLLDGSGIDRLDVEQQDEISSPIAGTSLEVGLGVVPVQISYFQQYYGALPSSYKTSDATSM
jgi:hypothetical protein